MKRGLYIVESTEFDTDGRPMWAYAVVAENSTDAEQMAVSHAIWSEQRAVSDAPISYSVPDVILAPEHAPGVYPMTREGNPHMNLIERINAQIAAYQPQKPAQKPGAAPTEHTEPLKTFRFSIPATFYFSVEATTEGQARQRARLAVDNMPGYCDTPLAKYESVYIEIDEELNGIDVEGAVWLNTPKRIPGKDVAPPRLTLENVSAGAMKFGPYEWPEPLSRRERKARAIAAASDDPGPPPKVIR